MSAVVTVQPVVPSTGTSPFKCSVHSCSRVQWLCDELGVPYDLEKAHHGALESASCLKIAPLNAKAHRQSAMLAPIIESGAVLMHITSTYGNGRLSIPPNDKRFPQYVRWIWACESGAMMLIEQLHEVRLEAPSAHRDQKLAQLRSTAFDLFGHADLAVRGQEYIMGVEFTVADIMLCYAVSAVFGSGLLQRCEVPHLAEYVDRVRARPACKLSAL